MLIRSLVGVGTLTDSEWGLGSDVATAARLRA